MPLIDLASTIYERFPLTSRRRLALHALIYRILGRRWFADRVNYQAWLRDREARRQARPGRVVNPAPAAARLQALRFAPGPRPTVAVIVDCCGSLERALDCLEAIAHYTDESDISIHIRSETSEIGQALRVVPGIGFLPTDALAPVADDAGPGWRYLALVSDAVQVTAGWLDALRATFGHFPAAGIAGALVAQADGGPYDAGRPQVCTCEGRRGCPPQGTFASCHCYARAVEALPCGAWLADARSLGLDGTGFAPRGDGLWAAWARRGRARALRCVVQPTAVAVAARLGDVPTAAVGAPDPGPPRPLVLVIDQYIPRPDRDAGSRSTDHLMQALSAMGWELKFWPALLWRDPDYAARLQARGIEVYYDAECYAGRLAKIVRSYGERLHAVVLNRPGIALAHLAELRGATRARILYYGHDVHYLRLASARERAGAGRALRVRAMRRLEERIWRSADVVYYPSPAEVELVRAASPLACAEVLPLFAFDPVARTPARAQRVEGRLLFVGSAGHPPNADAIGWFIERILPQVRGALPQAHVVVVGALPRDAAALARPGVALAGRISEDELAAHYGAAIAAIAPLRMGAGVKGKVLEALHRGVPVVTTRIGAEGLGEAGPLLEIGDAPGDFAARVVDVLRWSAERWSARSAAGQAYIERHFSPRAMQDALRRGLEAPLRADRQGARVRNRLR